MDNILRISGIVRESIVDGPGLRFVLFTKGCPHRCPGCHNPDTHDFEGGNDITVERLLEEIDKNPLLQGVTLSGGEPFCQPEALSILGEEVLKRGLDLMAYSGWTFEELMDISKERPAVRELLEKCSLLIDGRFELEKKSLSILFRGSTNQRINDVKASLKEGKAVEKDL